MSMTMLLMNRVNIQQVSMEKQLLVMYACTHFDSFLYDTKLV